MCLDLVKRVEDNKELKTKMYNNLFNKANNIIETDPINNKKKIFGGEHQFVSDLAVNLLNT